MTNNEYRLGRCVVIAAACLVLTSGQARAADCANAATQAALNDCAGIRFRNEDARLNGVYGQIMRRLNGQADAKARLLAAQRAWLVFRDAECAFVGGASQGGSAQAMVVADRKADLTHERVARLEAYLRCGEGDLSCPVPPS